MKGPDRDYLALAGNIAGIASLVLAVAQANVGSLRLQQRWGLAAAAAAMIWAFLFGSQVNLVRRHAPDSGGKRMGLILLTGVIGSGLLLAVLPYFAFGLGEAEQETVAILAGCLYLGVSVAWAIASLLAGFESGTVE